MELINKTEIEKKRAILIRQLLTAQSNYSNYCSLRRDYQLKEETQKGLIQQYKLQISEIDRCCK